MYHGTVSYCPEDDKLRLYVGRVPHDEYERLREAGFISTPKQDCNFVAVWTPSREDLAREYLEDDEDIGDEDYSPEERSADRAERFGDYRDKRADEAGASADAFEAGPSAFGHQNRSRAERQAKRHDRHRTYAVGQWDKAEYWQQRTAGVIAHALHKSSLRVRRGRLLTLEAEQRKQAKSLEECQAKYDTWEKIATMEGAEELIPADGDWESMNAAQRLAHNAAATNAFVNFYHPTCQAANEQAREIWKHGFSTYDLLTKTEFIGQPFEQLSPKQVAELYLAQVRNPSTPSTRWQRWKAHYALRIGYEKAMLENEGGLAGEAEMEVGGWIRGSSRRPEGDWRQIHKINKSPATKRVTSVEVMGTHTGFTKESGYKESATTVCRVLVKMDRLGEDSYRAPTDEERAAFADKKKANKPAPVPTLNPTEEDAERLQQLLNREAADSARSKSRGASADRPVHRTTQAEFSHRSGDNGHYRIYEFTRFNTPFKVRLKNRGYFAAAAADSVVVLTDKPQKPLPVDWEAVLAPPVPEGCLV